MTSTLLIEGVNPEPWTSPEVAIARKNGKPFPVVHKSAGLKAYQEAVKGALVTRYPNIVPFPVDVEIELRFYLWRQLPAYEGSRNSRVVKHQADATNMQKALEDALQGVLFVNDRQVSSITTWIMEQSTATEPAILIEVSQVADRPANAVALLKEWAVGLPAADPNEHIIPEGVF